MKVLFMTNIPAPYRVVFFNKLAKMCDLTVLFEKEKTAVRNKTWFQSNKFDFKYIMLSKRKIKTLFETLDEDYDLIIMGVYSTKIAAIARFYLKFKRKKYIISADGGFVHDKYILTKFIKTFFISSASYWLSSGKETTKYLKYYGANIQNIYEYHFTSICEEDIIMSPIEYSKKMKLRKKLGLECDKLFLSIGQINYRKGYDILIETIKKYNLKNAAFVIAGDGKNLEEYKNFILENNIQNVYFVGFKNKKEIEMLYKAADVFLFPTRYDIWGLVINEAMAYGLPIISSNGAISSNELLLQTNLYNPDDKKTLSNLIKKYSDMDIRELHAEGAKNIEIIKSYTIEKMVDDHITIFKQIMEKEGKI